MGSGAQYTFAIIVISLLCNSAYSEASEISNKQKINFLPQENSSRLTEFRNARKNIIFKSILDQEGRNYRHLYLLFDEHFKDEVQSLAQFAKERSGILTYQYDGTEIQLKNLLGRVYGPTVLLLLCSPIHIIIVFEMIQFLRLKSHQVHWLVIPEDSQDVNWITLSLQDLVLEGTRVTLALPEEGGRKFSLLSSRGDANGLIRFTKIAKHIPNKGVQSSWGTSPVSRDLEGRRMKVAAVNNYGLCNLGRREDGTVETATGVDFALVEMLSRVLNFTFSVVVPRDGSYGNPLPNGTVTGMVGMVARREVEFATCSVTLTGQRNTVVDYPYPFFRAPLGLFSRSPKEKDRVMAIFSPFTFQVWLCLIASVLLVGPIAAVPSKLLVISPEESAPWDLQSYSFNMFRSFMVQTNRIVPSNWSQRLMFFFWYLFCIIISAVYSGMLTAVLTVPAFETPIDFLKDLPKAVKAGFSIGVIKNSAHELLFREAESGTTYGEVWKLFDLRNPERSFVDSNTAGVERVLERDFVYIGYTAACEVIASRLGRSKFHIAKETFFSADTGIAAPQGAPYVESFSRVILRLIEGGFRSKWKADELRRLASSVPKESLENLDQDRAITLRHLQAAFFLVVIGFASSAVVLVLEKVLFSCHEWKDEDRWT